MNLASQAGEQQSNLLFVNFNQDCSSLAVGTKTGYKLFSLNYVDKLETIYDNESDDICIVERLFSSSLVAIVSLSSPRKLKVCHFKKGTEICNYSYSNSILAVKLNRQRLVVCLEESLYIHNIRDMKVLHTIRDTPPNPSGLCALAVSNDNCFLAYPGSNQIGEVQIFDTINLRAVTMIPAHDNPLAAVSFSGQGTKLATASEKGTVIRVFSIPDGQKLFEFRRGVKRCVTIYSLGFSTDCLFLCASSNTETVHIFKLETIKDKPLEEPQGWSGYFGQALKMSANYLPAQVSDMINQGRSFATARLNTSGLRNVCSLAIIQKTLRLLVASQDGILYIYNIDPSEGGDCTLVRQHRLDGQSSDTHIADTSHDRPLAHPSGGSGTSPSPMQRGGEDTLGGVTTGKPTPAQTTPVLNSDSYADVLKRRGGPQDTVAIMDELLACQESEPYQEPEQGAVGGGDMNAEGQGLTTLRLDDDNEFPPMTHKND